MWGREEMGQNHLYVLEHRETHKDILPPSIHLPCTKSSKDQDSPHPASLPELCFKDSGSSLRCSCAHACSFPENKKMAW